MVNITRMVSRQLYNGMFDYMITPLPGPLGALQISCLWD